MQPRHFPAVAKDVLIRFITRQLVLRSEALLRVTEALRLAAFCWRRSGHRSLFCVYSVILHHENLR